MLPFSAEQTWLKCINPECGHKADLLMERKFTCPLCRSLYDIEHNFSYMPLRGGRFISKGSLTYNFTKMFRARRSSSQDPRNPINNSGVWGFKEFIMPYLPNEHIVSLGEGNVPIMPAGPNLLKWVGGSLDLYIIYEGISPTGSFKDMGMTVRTSVAKTAGITHESCASTGDTSASAAAYAAKAGINCSVILPKGGITPVQLMQPLAHGAQIIQIPGNFDDCMRVLRDLVENYGVYPANSLHPARIEGHQATVFLIAQHFDWKLPDWIAIPVGNGSNSSSIGKALRLLQRFGYENKTQILGCQASANAAFAMSWKEAKGALKDTPDPKKWLEIYERKMKSFHVGETTATAAKILNATSKAKVIREINHSNGAMEVASERMLNKAVSVCGSDGFLICPQTGIALDGVRRAVKAGQIKKGQRVIVVSTATGLKFGESIAVKLAGNIINANNASTKTVASILGL